MTQTTKKRVAIEAAISILIIAGMMALFIAVGFWIAEANDFSLINVGIAHIHFYRITEAIGQFYGHPLLTGLILFGGGGSLLLVGLMEGWRKVSRLS
ncbi:LlsX family protein [Levilactobacillus cerevisiae]|uniref:LlsX family protein n=1 Tax=Levilactobacillus cerevisiae TaxID=1704076 RepID=UPI000F76DD6F|nr:LlsX family protein [Levilactobacillus cerevisiae]